MESTSMYDRSEVVQLCVKGTQAEFTGRIEDAQKLYAQAWEIATSDEEACIAAHYIAHLTENPEEKLRWNQIALERADSAKTVNPDAVIHFYPSLYLNMGQSHEMLGHTEEAQRFYNLAASLGANHDQEQQLCRK